MSLGVGRLHTGDLHASSFIFFLIIILHLYTHHLFSFFDLQPFDTIIVLLSLATEVDLLSLKGLRIYLGTKQRSGTPHNRYGGLPTSTPGP